MESKGFEESFKNAFDGAEVSPSTSVWTNVELDLEKASGGKMKRNLLMFQLLAAASTVFALGIGGMYYLNTQPVEDKVNDVAVAKPKIENAQVPDNKNGVTESQTAVEQNAQEKVKTQNIDQRAVANNANVKAQTSSKVVSNKSQNSAEEVVESSSKQLQPLGKAELIASTTSGKRALKPALVEFKFKKEEPVAADPVMVMMARLEDREKQLRGQDNESRTSEKIWTSVGLGAGSYRPKFTSSSASLLDNSKPHEVSGASYSANISVGGKVSKRFVVQGGISYLTQSADFTSNVTQNGSATLTGLFNVANFTDFVSTTPYTVNSNLQFVSIPVQAGYLILDRDFAIQLNGGISTDLFLRNTLTAENTDYRKVVQSAGSESPYRTVNFSGLLGTEFSYRIADRYRISLNPGLRYSINSIYKSEVAAEISPVTYDVSLRFRYIFK